VFATSVFCETIIHPKEEVIEFTVRTTQNTGVELAVEG
jgi:hypothetical protein